jgi:hypothetical protein
MRALLASQDRRHLFVTPWQEGNAEEETKRLCRLQMKSTDQLENRVVVRDEALLAHIILPQASEAEFLAEIQSKVFRVFLLAVHSQISSFR